MSRENVNLFTVATLIMFLTLSALLKMFYQKVLSLEQKVDELTELVEKQHTNE